jgi:mannose/fructose/N-acetylgalactosamine-specific phosphotransferase system component IIC
MEGSWRYSYRSSIISLIVFFVVGFVLLATLNVRRARAIARVGKGLAFYGDKLPAVRAGA